MEKHGDTRWFLDFWVSATHRGDWGQGGIVGVLQVFARANGGRANRQGVPEGAGGSFLGALKFGGGRGGLAKGKKITRRKFGRSHQGRGLVRPWINELIWWGDYPALFFSGKGPLEDAKKKPLWGVRPGTTQPGYACSGQ